MDESILGDDPLAQPAGEPAVKAPPRQPFSQDVVNQLRDRQDRFIALAEDFYKLWRALPDLNVRQVDVRLVAMYEQLLELAPTLGVSRNGLQQLRECCGKKRVWPAGLEGDPALSIRREDAVRSPFYQEELAWWPGDIIRRITRWLGVPYCKKCDRRRRIINAICGKALWDWLKRK